MAKTLVWSERPEPHAPGLRDCTYSAALMALVYGGFTKFPLGIYTVAEREALERSDDQPDETGSSQSDITTAVKRRYGLVLRRVPETLAVALTKVGRAYTLAGANGRLPKGHTLRRWDPTFVGAHAVCVVPLGGGRSRWFDPEAPNKYAGDVVNNDTILQWAYGGSDNMRMILVDEFVPALGGTDVVPIADPTPKLGDLLKGTQLYSLDKKPLVTASIDVKGKYFPFRVDSVYSGMFRDSTDELVLVKTADIKNLKPYATGVVDCGPAVVAATAPLQVALAASEAKVTAQAAELADWQDYKAASAKVGL